MLVKGRTAMPVSRDPHIAAIATAFPPARWGTEELIELTREHLSDALVAMIRRLGVDYRHSVLANYPDVLATASEPKLEVSCTSLAAQAVRLCLARAVSAVDTIGLVLGVSSSPGRLLPSLTCDLMASLPEIPRSASTLSIGHMGCSSLAKVVDTARWYLTCHPDRQVLACFMDAITPLSPPFAPRCVHFSEGDESTRQDTVDVMHGFLFGDAAVAMLLTADSDGPSFGPVVHLTNEQPDDAELGTVPDGGSDDPIVRGHRRKYLLSPDVAARGQHYASATVRKLLDRDDCPLETPSQASALLMHTGSEKILDLLCAEFGVARDSDQVAISYRVLRERGNTIGCSVPLMLAEPAYRPEGNALLMAFGLSFSAGAMTLRIPAGGWTP